MVRTLIVFMFMVCMLVFAETGQADDGVPPMPLSKPEAAEKIIQIDALQLKKPPFEKLKRQIKPDFSDRSDLSARNKKLYREIFSAQRYSDWETADEKIKQLDDYRLMGYVLFQRYMHPRGYRSKFLELRDWLAIYNDHAGADEIFDLAMARKPKAAKAPKSPDLKKGIIGRSLSFSRVSTTYKSRKRRSHSDYQRYLQIRKQVSNDLKCCGAATRALGRLNTAEAVRIFDPVEADILKGQIANTYFYLDRIEKAYKTASGAADRSGVKAPLAAWIAGLSAWHKRDYEAAARYFEIAANSDHANGWTASASAFWASRAFLRIRKPQKVNYWLEKAAVEPRTFYGLIARRALGLGYPDLRWNLPPLKPRHIEKIKNYEAGFRAHLLLQVGQRVLAEQELMQINPRNDNAVEQALLAYAAHHKLPAILLKMGTVLENPKGGYYDAALYPQGQWDQGVEHDVDWALIHALIRQESRFDPHARSSMGAAGLMQILPSTASHLANEEMNGKDRYKLLDPNRNVALGGQYLEWLLSLDSIENDLFKTVIAYNAGPGNMARWWRELEHRDDPLFFIETIPVAETRAFVEKVMSNFWIYRMRFNQPTPSLTKVAGGYWPTYQSFD